MARFFSTPFAQTAAKTTIPESDNESISWKNGYTAFYEYDPTVENSQAKHIERDAFNTLLYEVTSSIQAIQLSGIAPYYDEVITTTGPGYALGAVVAYAGKIWRSKISNNKIKPNETIKNNWEQIFGYDSLVAQLVKDSYINSSGGGNGENDSYTRTEIDNKIAAINTTIDDYLYKEPGEIYLLSWCDSDRNGEGFFLCNGDKLPYTTGTPSSSEEFHGTQLYNLCYNDGEVTAFKTRWDIQIDTANKMIQLPNILAGVSEAQNVLLGLSTDSGITNIVNPKYFSSGEVATEAEKLGNVVYRFNLLPCMYLDVYGDDN